MDSDGCHRRFGLDFKQRTLNYGMNVEITFACWQGCWLLVVVGVVVVGIDLIISFIAVISWEGRGKGEHGEHGVSRSRREDE